MLPVSATFAKNILMAVAVSIPKVSVILLHHPDFKTMIIDLVV
jgi:hypothetical protein